MDVALFRWINGWPEWFAPIFVFFSEATKNPLMRVFLVIVFIAFLFNKNVRPAALIAAIGWPLANFLCDVLKNATQMQRPCVELLDVNLHVAKLTSFGMPSAHSANMACIAAVFLWLCPRLGYVWGGIALLTGISRIYVGVHYPSQVLVGWTVGAAVGTIGVLIYKQILKRRISESPAEVP